MKVIIVILFIKALLIDRQRDAEEVSKSRINKSFSALLTHDIIPTVKLNSLALQYIRPLR